MKQTVEDYVVALLGAVPAQKADEYVADCPVCAKPGHFGFNVRVGVGHCWVCGYSPNVLRLLQDVEGLPYAQAYEKMIVLRNTERTTSTAALLTTLRDRLYSKPGPDARDVQEVELPGGAVPITDRHAEPGLRYLERRGFIRRIGQIYGLLYVPKRCAERRYAGHLVFPVYDIAGRVVHWTTRAAYEQTGDYPKSYHVQGKKGGVLYGRHVVQARQCILVEGPLDTLATYPLGVGTLGRVLTTEQAYALASEFIRVTICYDSDAAKQAIEAAGTLIRAGCREVCISTPDGEDPADALSNYGGNTIQNTAGILQRRRACTLEDFVAKKWL